MKNETKTIWFEYVFNYILKIVCSFAVSFDCAELFCSVNVVAWHAEEFPHPALSNSNRNGTDCTASCLGRSTAENEKQHQRIIINEINIIEHIGKIVQTTYIRMYATNAVDTSFAHRLASRAEHRGGGSVAHTFSGDLVVIWCRTKRITFVRTRHFTSLLSFLFLVKGIPNLNLY